MSANTFGNRLLVTSFGESHGVALGALIDGCPAGVLFDPGLLLSDLQRRRPGQSSLVSPRQEQDVPEILSGVYQGKTLGTPIAILVRNQDTKSEDYQEIAVQPRPGHADDLWKIKFGHADPRGGGRSSGRETVARVMGGSVARMILKELCPSVRLLGFASQIGPLALNESEIVQVEQNFISNHFEVDSFSSRMPNKEKNAQIEELLQNAKREGQSYGGTAEIFIHGLPVGLGQPVFHKLKADLTAALMGVGAVVGVEFGDGRKVLDAEGSQFHRQSQARHYGGIRGGLSTGEPVLFRVFFKPTATVLDVAKKGRHDPCIVIRAIPVLEAMAWMVIADHVLWARQDKII